jgi:hypothetical protein
MPRSRGPGAISPSGLGTLSPLLPDTPQLPGMQSMHGHVDDSLPYAASAPASPHYQPDAVAGGDAVAGSALDQQHNANIVIRRNNSGLLGLRLEGFRHGSASAANARDGVVILQVAPSAITEGPRKLRAGDRILAIDGIDCGEMSLAEVEQLLRERQAATLTVRTDLRRSESLSGQAREPRTASAAGTLSSLQLRQSDVNAPAHATSAAHDAPPAHEPSSASPLGTAVAPPALQTPASRASEIDSTVRVFLFVSSLFRSLSD